MLVRTDAGGCSPRAARALLLMELALLRGLVEMVLASTMVLLLRGCVVERAVDGGRRCLRVLDVVVDRCEAALVVDRPSARRATGSNVFPAPWRGMVVGL